MNVDHRGAEQPTRLYLVRHGRSAYEHDGSWIDAAGARRFEERYDAAPIRPGEAPPPSLCEIARRANVVLASDLARGISSARALAPDRDPIVTPLLRELSFTLPVAGPRLPVDVWDALHHVGWTIRMMLGVENDETLRARRAAEWVESHADGAGTVVVVTHGGFRRLLAMQLAVRGYTAAKPVVGRYAHWSVWVLRRSSSTTAPTA